MSLEFDPRYEDGTVRDVGDRLVSVKPLALAVRMASGSKLAPIPRPFKEGSDLTCQHGRFWRSCQRCRYEK